MKSLDLYHNKPLRGMMQFVNKVAPDMEGADKKQLVIDAVTTLPPDSFPHELMNVINAIIQTNILPDFIETAMDISRGVFDFKLIKKDVIDVETVAVTCVPLFRSANNAASACFRKNQTDIEKVDVYTKGS